MDAPEEWTKRTMSMRDDEGRPLGENKAPPELFHGVPMELRTCPYADSRHNHVRPMNVSALKQMLAHWEDVLGGLALLRSLYCAGAKREQMRLIDVWRLGGMTTSLADFAFLRAWAPVTDGRLPAQVAVLYKAPLGVALTSASMWADGAARFEALIKPDALYEYADRHGHFIGPKHVCAGPVTMVKEVLRQVIDGSRPGDQAAAAAVIGDSQRFMQFSHAVASLHLLRMALDRMDAGMGSDLAQALAADPACPNCRGPCGETSRWRATLASTAGRGWMSWRNYSRTPPTLTLSRRRWGLPSRRFARRARPLEDEGPMVRDVVAASPQARPLRPETKQAIGKRLARFCAVEYAFAVLVRRCEGRIADALGIDLTHERCANCTWWIMRLQACDLTRTILHDVFDIAVRVEGGRLFLAWWRRVPRASGVGRGFGHSDFHPSFLPFSLLKVYSVTIVPPRWRTCPIRSNLVRPNG